jgi:glycosyltransferase involved in cell wall biosynthesis
VLEPTGTPRYSRAEGTELAEAARGTGADLIHALDYRIPLNQVPVPVIATVHDVLRLDQGHCYSDEQFTRRFGRAGMAELREAVHALPCPPLHVAVGTADSTSMHAEFYARMLGWTCGEAARIVTPTRTVARQLADHVRLTAEPTAIPLGIDHRPDEVIADSTRTDSFRVVPGRGPPYVGQPRPHKGLATLMAAYQCSNARNDGVYLVCVGRDFASGSESTLQLREALGDYAVALGAVSDRVLQDLYARAEALVHLAVHEGFGFTPLEALAAGTRVIASDIPVLRETLGLHAQLIEPRSPLDAAAAIDRILTEPDKLRARAQRTRWARQYTWRRHAKQLARLYRECSI